MESGATAKQSFWDNVVSARDLHLFFHSCHCMNEMLVNVHAGSHEY